MHGNGSVRQMTHAAVTPEAFAVTSLQTARETKAMNKDVSVVSNCLNANEDDKLSCEGLVEERKNAKVDDGGSVEALQERLRSQLDLNAASETDIVNGLSGVRGVGTLSVNRIVTQRFIDGHFLDERDFNRRVRHMSLRRLRRLSHSAGLEIKLGETDKAQKLRGGMTQSKKDESERSAKSQNGKAQCFTVDTVGAEQVKRIGDGMIDNNIREVRRWTWSACSEMWDRDYSVGNVSEDLSTITIASWNTARLSPHTATFWSKVRHILTFVEDSKADIVALQEVNSEGLGPLCRALSQATGDSWILKHDAVGSMSDKSLALLVRTSTVTLHQVERRWHQAASNDSISSLISEEACNRVRKGIRTLTRVPQIYSVRATRNGGKSSMVTLAHVHVSCSETRLETEVLGESLRHYEEEYDTNGVTVLIGDFNASATEKSSDALRAAGFVEVFSPLGVTADGMFTTVSSSTTAAGRWLDNVWVREDLRRHVRNAWCFDVASRRRSLTQSQRAYAAARRASHSDHLPLMVTLDMCA